MKKVYLAHPISTTGEFNDSIRVAERIKSIYRTKDVTTEENDVMGTVNEPKYDVYAPALNKAINDKSNNPTPQMIYEQDVERLIDSDIVVINYTGGDADGTVLEIGLLGGMVEGVQLLTRVRNEMMNDDEYVEKVQKNLKYETGTELYKSDIKAIQLEILGEMVIRYLRKLPDIYVYSSNQRATKPQLYNLVLNKLYEAGIDDLLEGFIPSGKLNAFVLGLIERYFEWCENEDDMIVKLSQL